MQHVFVLCISWRCFVSSPKFHHKRNKHLIFRFNQLFILYIFYIRKRINMAFVCMSARNISTPGKCFVLFVLKLKKFWMKQYLDSEIVQVMFEKVLNETCLTLKTDFMHKKVYYLFRITWKHTITHDGSFNYTDISLGDM